MLNTGSKNIRCQFAGPLAIWKCVSPNLFLLMFWDGKLYPYLIEETRIKPGFVRMAKGNVTHMSSLRQVIKSGKLGLFTESVITQKIMTLFRWFKFTLKPPYTVVIGNFFLAI